jgi:hypothetical protein
MLELHFLVLLSQGLDLGEGEDEQSQNAVIVGFVDVFLDDG